MTAPLPANKIPAEPLEEKTSSSDKSRSETPEFPAKAGAEMAQDPAGPHVHRAKKASRTTELRQAFLILGAIVLIGLTFYIGTKFSYLKYLVTSREKPALENVPDQFPGVTANDLVDQALAAERAGKWDEAVVRFMAAKRKNLHYRGILFRVGKILYDHREFDQADQAFERSIAFDENVEASNFFRGLIATRHRDLPAAERFFEGALTAAPFVSDYHYYLGEALRIDLKPGLAIPHYERARLLARDEQDATVCLFKIRMARIEAAESAAVSAELAKRQAAGPLPVDWLMTAAALKIHDGQPNDALELVEQARAGKSPGLFASCVSDFYFQEAVKKFPELASALQPDLDLQEPFPE